MERNFAFSDGVYISIALHLCTACTRGAWADKSVQLLRTVQNWGHITAHYIFRKCMYMFGRGGQFEQGREQA